MKNPTERFTTRVSDYLKARPGYPAAIVQMLQQYYELTPEAVVGDIGSGTGLLTELFLKNGNPVYGVEPNEAMRKAGETYLSAYPKFTSIKGCAEATTLPLGSCDFIVAGQAFHWFDASKTRHEFRRILKPNGWMALIWNTMPHTNTCEFSADYERMFTLHGVSYQGGSNRHADASNVLPFFETKNRHKTESENTPKKNVTQFRFPNPCQLTEADFYHRVFSSSQAPEPGQPSYLEMQATSTQLFHQYANQGLITMPYETLVYIGQL